MRAHLDAATSWTAQAKRMPMMPMRASVLPSSCSALPLLHSRIHFCIRAPPASPVRPLLREGGTGMTSNLANDARLPRARMELGRVFAFPQARAWKAPNAAREGAEDSRFHSGGKNMTGQTSLTTAQRTIRQQGIIKPKTMDRRHRGALNVMLVALILTFATVLGSGSLATAADPPDAVLDFPAGIACPNFDLRVEIRGGN
jgi:hypothetical protein